MVKGADHSKVEKFGGPGSSHQDRDHPGKNRQSRGHKAGGSVGPPKPDAPTNDRTSRISGGGGERDLHHAHMGKRS